MVQSFLRGLGTEEARKLSQGREDGEEVKRVENFVT